MNPEDLPWSFVDYQEYPTPNEWVWATDFKTVFKAKWEFSGIGIPLEKGPWIDQAGNAVHPAQWLFVSECTDGPPPVPPTRKLCTGGIVAFLKAEEEAGPAEDWKK
jgi:hypothetical protein